MERRHKLTAFGPSLQKPPPKSPNPLTPQPEPKQPEPEPRLYNPQASTPSSSSTAYLSAPLTPTVSVLPSSRMRSVP